ncbi:MAG: hypothetical protein JWO76_2596, partial [Nocardioides sp.]|nr:hypothetical protein [Nocardioides sp.]
RFRHGGGVRVDLVAGRSTGQGHDRIVVDQVLDVVGSDKDDVLLGTDHGEVLSARGGDDRVESAGGRDFVVEGDAPNGDDTYLLGDGNDFFGSLRGQDTVDGGPGNDELNLWSPAITVVDGGPGDDEIRRYAGPDGDVLLGGDGIDELTVSVQRPEADAAVLDIPAGTLTFDDRKIQVGGVESWALAFPIPLTVYGSEDADTVYGTGLGDKDAAMTAYLRGGDDTARGYLADDYVDGGDGVDTADLGPGTNTCVNVEAGPC